MPRVQYHRATRCWPTDDANGDVYQVTVGWFTGEGNVRCMQVAAGMADAKGVLHQACQWAERGPR
jgi:hypothetical protein